jgi:uncharacterized membrane protein YgdD (TMEM256/DUF423 family)
MMKKYLILAGFILMIAVIMGAFGAHGLENKISEKAMQTYQTGVRYHFYHGLAIMLVAIIGKLLNLNLKLSKNFFITGIILFSGNCYLYAMTGIKTFAMIVPIGGVAFIIGWLAFSITLLRTNSIEINEA